MNKVILMGRLTKDPDVRYTQTNKVVCQFTLAVDRPFTNQDGQREADFIQIVVWGKIGEAYGNNLSKGKRALVEGRLQIRSYDAKDGRKCWISEVIASHVTFLSYKSDKDMPAAASAPLPSSVMDGFGESCPFDEEIPF